MVNTPLDDNFVSAICAQFHILEVHNDVNFPMANYLLMFILTNNNINADAHLHVSSGEPPHNKTHCTPK